MTRMEIVGMRDELNSPGVTAKYQMKNVKMEITGDDFREGLTAVISVKVQEPQFEGQTKTKLGNNELMGAVDMAVGYILGNFLEENRKDAGMVGSQVIVPPNPRWALR